MKNKILISILAFLALIPSASALLENNILVTDVLIPMFGSNGNVSVWVLKFFFFILVFAVIYALTNTPALKFLSPSSGKKGPAIVFSLVVGLIASVGMPNQLMTNIFQFYGGLVGLALLFLPFIIVLILSFTESKNGEKLPTTYLGLGISSFVLGMALTTGLFTRYLPIEMAGIMRDIFDIVGVLLLIFGIINLFRFFTTAMKNSKPNPSKGDGDEFPAWPSKDKKEKDLEDKVEDEITKQNDLDDDTKEIIDPDTGEKKRKDPIKSDPDNMPRKGIKNSGKFKSPYELKKDEIVTNEILEDVITHERASKSIFQKIKDWWNHIDPEKYSGHITFDRSQYPEVLASVPDFKYDWEKNLLSLNDNEKNVDKYSKLCQDIKKHLRETITKITEQIDYYDLLLNRYKSIQLENSKKLQKSSDPVNRKEIINHLQLLQKDIDSLNKPVYKELLTQFLNQKKILNTTYENSVILEKEIQELIRIIPVYRSNLKNAINYSKKLIDPKKSAKIVNAVGLDNYGVHIKKIENNKRQIKSGIGKIEKIHDDIDKQLINIVKAYKDSHSEMQNHLRDNIKL